MNDTVKLGAAVAGGYLLGRTRKGKAAIGLALWLAGRRRSFGSPGGGLSRLLSTPEIGQLTAQLRGPLLGAAQRAVTSTIESRAGSLADSLRDRTARLGGPPPGGQDQDQAGQDGNQAGQDGNQARDRKSRGKPRDGEGHGQSQDREDQEQPRDLEQADPDREDQNQPADDAEAGDLRDRATTGRRPARRASRLSEGRTPSRRAAARGGS